VNDHDAMDAVNAVLDEWFKGGLNASTAVIEIAKISGLNKIEHEEQKK
jgi:glycerate kinase